MKKGRGVLAACLSRTIEFTKREPYAVAFGKNKRAPKPLIQKEGIWGPHLQLCSVHMRSVHMRSVHMLL